MSILRPMNHSEYVEWLAETIPAYAADKVESGQWSEEKSVELSTAEFEELLPQGLSTHDNYLFTLLDTASTPVGFLWFAVKEKPGGRIAYVYDVSVNPEHQRKGHAHRAFLALEREVQRLGLAGIALNVFGHNTAARALYDKLGYSPTNINLFKPVPPPTS